MSLNIDALTSRFAVLPRPSLRAWTWPLAVLPSVQIRSWLALHWRGVWPWLLVALSGLAHGVNMLNFPYYDNDEGTYVSQAWAILERGTLAQYTYWYDHAPAGWMQIAVWAAFFNGFYTFGTSVDSGRVLMLVYQCFATYLVYRIAYVVSRSVTTATLCTLLFALSAYGIYFHRRVLLDNLTTPWMLLSILLVVRSPLALTRVWGSAVALAVSILSKELTIFLVPVLAAVVFLRADRSQRWFAVCGWLILVGAIFGTYPLMALLKNELFPAGTLLGGSEPHVSLIESLRYQMGRGKDAGLWGFESGFWGEMRIWAEEEPLLVIGGTAAALLSSLAIWWYPVHGALGLLTLSLYAFLGRGGTVIGFYLVPLLPLLALNLGLIVGPLVRQLQLTVLPGGPLETRLTRAVGGIAAGLCLTVLVQAYYSTNLGFAVSPFTLWTNTQVAAQNDAVAWVRRNVRNDAALIMDCYPWLDLQSPPPGLLAFPKAHWYWKLDADPEVGIDVFRGDPRTADYLLLTPQMVKDADSDPSLALVRGALAASTPIHRIDTGGYPVEIRRVRKLQQWPATSNPMLTRSWADFKARFISNGRVSDLGPARVTTAEGQASALLRAVYHDDRATFDAVWAWTRTRLQVRGDGLLASRWGAGPNGTEAVLDAASATEADQDAALALLFAARRWHSPEYQRHAATILAEIWQRETTVVGGRRIVVAGDWARGDGGDPVVTPAALAPYAYRVFADADPGRPWLSLVDSSYALLAAIQARPDLGGAAGVVPNWIALDRTTGQPRPASTLGAFAAESSAEAGRLPTRLALDLIWFGEPRARQALRELGLSLRELSQTGRLAAAYQLDGTPATDRETFGSYAGALPGLLFRGDDDLAQRVFADKVLRAYVDSPSGTHWGDRDSADDQYRGWLATAFMDGSLTNLWAGQRVLDWASVQARVAALPAPTPVATTAAIDGSAPTVARR